jgi:hypothetical protein
MKIIYTLLTILCFLSFSCKSRKQSSSSLQPVAGISVPSGSIQRQTIHENSLDTSRSLDEIKTSYQRDPEILNTLKPYFKKDICPPGDTKNPVYKAFMSKGKSMEGLVLDKLEARLRRDSNGVKEITKRLGNINELKNCRVKQIPIYYLTANVAQYQKGESVTQYFTLDTTVYKFLVVKGGELITMAGNNKGMWRRYEVFPKDTLAYERLTQLGKEPIGFNLELNIDEYGPYPSHLGFMSGNRIIFADCVSRNYQRQLIGGAETIKQIFEEGCAIRSAEAYLTDDKYFPTVLKSMLTSAYRYIKQYKTQ